MNINPENSGAAARIYHDCPCAGSWHKFFYLAGFVLFSLFLALAAAGCKKQANEITARDIEVIRVERRQATIAWTTGNAFQGEVFYRAAAGGNTAEAVKETLSKSFHHQVVLTNLKPGTHIYLLDRQPGKALPVPDPA